MTDDHVIDIRRYLDSSAELLDLRAFSVLGGGGNRSRLALPIWRAIHLVGGDWGGIVSMSKLQPEQGADPLFALDLKEDPARAAGSPEPLRVFPVGEAPSMTFGKGEGLAVLLGEDDERRWFLQILGVIKKVPPEGKDRETLLFLSGECAGLLFFRELATPLPSSSSAP